MSEARAILLEVGDDGKERLVGRWPDTAIIEPSMIAEFAAPGANGCALRMGDEFLLHVANGGATYRFVGLAPHGQLICARVR